MTRTLVLNTCPDSALGKALDEVVCRSSLLGLSLQTLQCSATSNPRLPHAIADIRPELIFCLLSNHKMDSGRRCLRSLQIEPLWQPLIAIADELSSQQVIELFEDGITDFVLAPIRESSLVPRVWRWSSLAASSKIKKPDRTALNGAECRLRNHGIIGRNKRFLGEAAKISTYGACDAPVLICGETGTGKELVARALHQMSPRANQPFVAVNCGAIPVDLVENELFGHERGAYTGSGGTHRGLIEEANGGTLFLDEVDSLPALAQVKLLRFLQEGEYRRLGSAKLRMADVRVVSAANSDLPKAIEHGRMRSDLFYRLNVLPISLPPLRDRSDDIPLLAAHFVEQYAKKFSKPSRPLSPRSIQRLMLSDWPGNVRELAYVIERTMLLGEEAVIGADDPTWDPDGSASTDISFKAAKAACVSDFERRFIEQGLRAFDGNISHAASAAGKNRRAYWELIRKYGIDVNQFKQS